MQHLTLEALARLADEPAEAHEAAHLRDCLACRREVEEMRALTRELAALPPLDPPAGAWAALEAELRAGGLVHDLAPARRVAAFGFGRPALRAAAAAAIFLVGGAAGVALMRQGPATGRVADADPPATRVLTPSVPAGGSMLAAVGPRGDGAAEVSPVERGPVGEPDLVIVTETPPPSSGARLASTGDAAPRRSGASRPAKAPPPEVRRAAAQLADAEVAYLGALQRYAALAGADSTADPIDRLAALERLVAATGAALERAPDNPVVNGYHLAALREREDLRRRIARASEETWF